MKTVYDHMTIVLNEDGCKSVICHCKSDVKVGDDFNLLQWMVTHRNCDKRMLNGHWLPKDKRFYKV